MRRAIQCGARLLAALACIACLACLGYRPVDDRGALDPELRQIQLRSLENRTTEPNFEGMLADALREEFARRGALKPILSDGPARAPFVLEGAIATSNVRSTAFSSVALSLEDQVDMTVSLSITRASTGEVVWETSDLTESERFASSPDPQVFESNKEQALRRISTRLARSVHDAFFQALVFQAKPAEAP